MLDAANAKTFSPDDEVLSFVKGAFLKYQLPFGRSLVSRSMCRSAESEFGAPIAWLRLKAGLKT